MASLPDSAARSHSGHSHHNHDNSFLTSSDKNDAGVKITRVGLFVNLGMAIGKGIGGYVFHSQGPSKLFFLSIPMKADRKQPSPPMQSTP